MKLFAGWIGEAGSIREAMSVDGFSCGSVNAMGRRSKSRFARKTMSWMEPWRWLGPEIASSRASGVVSRRVMHGEDAVVEGCKEARREAFAGFLAHGPQKSQGPSPCFDDSAVQLQRAVSDHAQKRPSRQ